LAELIQQVRPGNAYVTFSDKTVAGDQVSKYYQVPYSREALDVKRLASANEGAGVEALHLPAPNGFIAEDVSLVTLPGKRQAVPEVLLEAERQTIWFMPDDEFRIPRGITYINFRSPEVGVSAEQTALVALYTALLTDQVNELAYPAQLAGMHFGFHKHSQGITLRLGGYTDKQALLLQQLSQDMNKPRFRQRRFEDIRNDMIRKLENSVAKRPSSQVVDDLGEALQYGAWGEQALISALKKTDLAALDDYIRSFWNGATAEALIYGNYTPDRVEQLSGFLGGMIGSDRAPALPERKILKLAAGESVQYPVDVPHDDSVVAWYLQGAGDSWQDRAVTALTAQIMSSGFFQELRTEQQLGYVVGAYNYPKAEVPGMVMLIQSPVADANTVAVAMQDFMRGVELALDEEQFERHKVSLISDILRPDKNLAERAEFYWQSIARKEWDFDTRQTLADAVGAITLQSWKTYFEAVFLARRHSLQVVAPGRWGIVPKGDFRVYDSAEAIKRGHEVYLID
jgi:insulysin